MESQRDTTRCKATRKDGQRCTSAIVLPSGFCHMHDPERQAGLATVRAAGGKASGRAQRAQRLVPAVLRPVLDQLLAAVEEVHGGNIEPGQASAMASLAGAIVKVYDAGLIEERLAQLEAAAERRTA